MAGDSPFESGTLGPAERHPSLYPLEVGGGHVELIPLHAIRWHPGVFTDRRQGWNPVAVQMPLTSLVDGAVVMLDDDGVLLGGMPGSLRLVTVDGQPDISPSWQEAVEIAKMWAEQHG